MGVPVIIGAGLAGLSVALSMAPTPVLVLGRKLLPGMTSSSLAQGGIAAAVGVHDCPAFHAEDTMKAGAGLCDACVVKAITDAAPDAIERLIEWGVAFDRDEEGQLQTGLEGAHSKRRVVHAQGDSTGAIVMQALLDKVRETPSITIMQDIEVARLLIDKEGSVSGVVYRQGNDSDYYQIETDRVVLATGSACALWAHTTVPNGSWGHGLALAAQIGARLRDLEFVQFHPTALDIGCDPMPLISEAVRGEGAKLVTKEEGSFVSELAPRDVVARAIWTEIEKGRHVYLDARSIENFVHHFPTIAATLALSHIDPAVDLIPVRPVAHYHMGGIATDEKGQTNVKGLWACGECASTGLHGANRLASNSLLEAVVMGAEIAQGLSLGDHQNPSQPLVRPYVGDISFVAETSEEIKKIRVQMDRCLGVRRNEASIKEVLTFLEPLVTHSARAFVARMIAVSAIARIESRGAHERTDYPSLSEEAAKPFFVTNQNNEIKIGA